MESQTSKITEELFRSRYSNVSIQQLSDKPSTRASSVEKQPSAKSPARTPAAMPKTPQLVKVQVSPKMQNTKIVQSSGVKSNVTPVKANVNMPSGFKTPVQTKAPAVTKTPVTPKTPVNVTYTKTTATTKSPVVTKSKTPVPASPKSVKTPTQTKIPPSFLKSNQVKASPQVLKTTQNVVKQQSPVKQITPNVMKTPVRTPAPTAKDNNPDQSTMTVLTYHLPQTPQRSSNQLTIEKVEQQQRIPVSNQVVLHQVINNNSQLVLQNRVVPEASLQSVVIGTTAQATPQVVAPQVEITTSEHLEALQVTQQVTLYGPKGSTFTVDDVKKQINLSKPSTMTNVVSSTTSSIPATAPSSQQELKKVVLPARTQPVRSPARQVTRANQSRQQASPAPATLQQYPSTRGHTKQVSPKREIPMQKVSPMQPPPPPPPSILPDQLANEEEVTTSDDTTTTTVTTPQQVAGTQLIVILPSGEKKAITLPGDAALDCTLQALLEQSNISIPDDMLKASFADISGKSDVDNDQNPEGMEESNWEGEANIGGEPGEILGLQDDLQSVNRNTPQQHMQSEMEESHKSLGRTCRKTKADSLTGEDIPKKKRVCKKRRQEEPVCLTISDDEELLGLAHHGHMAEDSHFSDSNSQMSSCDKEPIITDDMVMELKHPVTGGGIDSEELLDNASPHEKTFLQCRTVRIGSYKVVPKDKVLITPYGLKFKVPILNSDQYVELKIFQKEIIKVLIHFGRQMPVLFFYTRPAAAFKIRKALRMDNKRGYYYDSTSSDETHRRITLLPDKIDEDCKQTLKIIFSNPENNVFAELNGKEANDILVKASPKEVQAFITKQSSPAPQIQPFNGQDIQTIMVYPPPPEKGGIPINTEDYACLGEDQFLNDVIIDFYLKYVVEKTLSPEDRARTHVFSSFFYKRLTTKPPAKRRSMNPVENDPAASPAAKRHSRVKGWTKNVNLFTKDFIVIPINENSHWFLAIVCFPGLTGPVRFSDNTPIDLPGRKKKQEDKAAVGTHSGKHTVTIGSTTITAVAPSNLDDTEDRDEADGEDEDMDVPDALDEDSPQKSILPDIKEEIDEEEPPVKRKLLREPIKQPCILIFDSLAGASRARVVATLRDYLRVEYEAKHGETRDFSGEVMKGSNTKCPQQTNYTDCGLYVLQYVEAFFMWPITDYHIPIKQVQDWFKPDIVSRKRYEIQQLLHRLMQEQNIDVDGLNLPHLNLKPEGKLVEYSGSECEEEDEEDEEEDEPMCEEEEDMLDDEGQYHDEDHEYMMGHDEMEEGEIGHHDVDDHDQFLHGGLEHDDHEMEDDEYGLEEEEEEDMEDMMHEDDDEDDLGDKELDDISLTGQGHNSMRGDNLKNYRIPRLVTKSSNINEYKDT